MNWYWLQILNFNDGEFLSFILRLSLTLEAFFKLFSKKILTLWKVFEINEVILVCHRFTRSLVKKESRTLPRKKVCLYKETRLKWHWRLNVILDIMGINIAIGKPQLGILWSRDSLGFKRLTLRQNGLLPRKKLMEILNMVQETSCPQGLRTGFG